MIVSCEAELAAVLLQVSRKEEKPLACLWWIKKTTSSGRESSQRAKAGASRLQCPSLAKFRDVAHFRRRSTNFTNFPCLTVLEVCAECLDLSGASCESQCMRFWPRRLGSTVHLLYRTSPSLPPSHSNRLQHFSVTMSDATPQQQQPNLLKDEVTGEMVSKTLVDSVLALDKV